MDLVIVGANQFGENIVNKYSLFGLRHTILGFVDDNLALKGEKLAGFSVLGQVEEVLLSSRVAVAIALTSVLEKVELIKKLSQNSKLEFPNLISSGTWISRDCIFGKGNVILEGSMINFGTMIGNYVFLGENCSIGHESVIEDFCNLENEVVLGGYVVLESSVTLKKGVWINQGVRIGKESLIEQEVKIREDVIPYSVIKR